MAAPDAAGITAALAEGSAEEREAAYALLETTMRSATSDTGRAQAGALAAACVRPLIASVLCAESSKVGREEYQRASLLLGEMSAFEPVGVGGAIFCTDAPNIEDVWLAPGSEMALLIAKDPGAWTRDDARTAAANLTPWAPLYAPGLPVTTSQTPKAEMDCALTVCSEPFGNPGMDPSRECGGKFIPAARLMLDMLRAGEFDDQPEPLVCGAWQFMAWTQFVQTGGFQAAMLEAGFLDVAMAWLARYNPMQRIGTKLHVPATILHAVGDWLATAPADLDVVGPLMEAGVVDLAIETLAAYKMLGRPQDANVLTVQYGALELLDTLLRSPEAEPVKSKLRSAGTDAFRYVLDHPLVIITGFMETGASATRVAALVWGRDEDGGDLTFKQDDIDLLVEHQDHRGPWANTPHLQLKEGYGQPLLCLSVSDRNKELLLNSKGFIPLLVDSLLLDEDHPRAAQSDFETVKVPVQRDFTEALEQLAVFPAGKAALLADPTVAPALEQVAEQGWCDEAQEFARGALAALSDREAFADVDEDHLHLMLSYQWDVQDTIRRIVAELQVRGYLIWWDLDHMKGNTVDAMSHAVDGAEVVLFGVSLMYKESANCRLEANYAHQQEKDMIPLMMEDGYKPKGWLGLILGTRLYYSFHPDAIDTDAKFIRQMDALLKEVGDRGKPKLKEGVPPAAAPGAPAPAPAAARSPRPQAPAPASAPAPAPTRSSALAPAPAPAPVVAPAAALTTTSLLASPRPEFSPSVAMTLAATPPPQQQQQLSTSTAAAGSFADMVSFMREERAHMEAKMTEQRDEAKAEMQAQVAELEAKLREELAPSPAVTDDQLSALQARIEAIHVAEMLSDDELYALEDGLADFFDLLASVDVVTKEMATTQSEAGKVLKLVVLSERMGSDAAFARQLRRRFC